MTMLNDVLGHLEYGNAKVLKPKVNKRAAVEG